MQDDDDMPEMIEEDEGIKSLVGEKVLVFKII